VGERGSGIGKGATREQFHDRGLSLASGDHDQIGAPQQINFFVTTQLRHLVLIQAPRSQAAKRPFSVTQNRRCSHSHTLPHLLSRSPPLPLSVLASIANPAYS